MTQEQLENRLRTVLRLVEDLHGDVQEDPTVEGATPDPQDIGPVAMNCATSLARIRASLECLTRDVTSRYLEIRGAVRNGPNR